MLTPRQVEVIDTDPQLPLAHRLRLVEMTHRPLGASQVRVGMLAMPIHPADVLQLDGRYGVKPPVPFVPGHEGVGIVIEHAPDVIDMPVGTRVQVMAAGGLWCDERVLHHRALLPLPDAGDVLQQAMGGANPATAWVMLRHLIALEPGSWVIQNAANSAVAACVRWLAPSLGLSVVNIVRRAQVVPEGQAAGAVWIVDEGVDPPALRQRVAAAVGAGRVALALDAVGGAASARLAACLDDEGLLVVFGLLSGQPSVLPADDLVFRGVRVQGFWLSRWFADPANRLHARALPADLQSLMARRELRVAVDSVHDLADSAAAVERARQPGRRGKVLLRGAWMTRAQALPQPAGSGSTLDTQP
jgi:NADPH:quinone reductase-like Zn-dependent oxidoreductase